VRQSFTTWIDWNFEFWAQILGHGEEGCGSYTVLTCHWKQLYIILTIFISNCCIKYVLPGTVH